jgi:glucose/arabinose dehydrogenase
VAYQVETLATGLDHPWGLAFLPDGAKLVTERAGRLRILGTDGKLSPPVAGLPAVYAEGQGGLLDVALDPDYAKNGLIYWTYAEPREGGNGTTAARGKLVLGAAPRLENVQVIWRQLPTMDSALHFGGRLAFARDGALFVTTGERSILPGRMQAQKLDAALGKVIRIRPDGSIPADNPYVGNPQAKPEIWSKGHRNCRARRSTPGPASCGPSSTAPRAATRSTPPRPARTTAGRPSPMARSIRASRSATGSPSTRAWSSRSTTGIR